MITLTFNSTAKTVRITQEGVLTEYQDVPTVKVREGFYEVMQKQSMTSETQIPVCRLPIANTIMFINK
jgi:hypothetical protein